MKLPGVAAYLLVLNIAGNSECHHTETLPLSFLRTGIPLNPIKAIRNLLPGGNSNQPAENVKLIPFEKFPVWKVHKFNTIILNPVAPQEASIPGPVGPLPEIAGIPPTVAIVPHPSYSPPNELEPPKTEYDPPFYTNPEQFVLQEPGYSSTPHSVSYTYSNPHEPYSIPNEYGPPKNYYYSPTTSSNINSEQAGLTNSNAQVDSSAALNALDALGPLANILPNTMPENMEGEGGGELLDLDLGELFKIASSLPKGSLEKIKAILGIYNARNNRERLKNLFDAKNATLRLKAGALNSLGNFVQDTYDDYKNGSTNRMVLLNGGINSNSYYRSFLNTPTPAPSMSNPFSKLFSNLFRRSVNVSSVNKEETLSNERIDNAVRELLLGNNGDAANLAIESGTYNDVPKDYPGRAGILPLIPSLSGFSRFIPVPNLPEPPLPSIKFLSKAENDISPPKFPYLYLPSTYNLSKLNRRYISFRFPKPVRTYSIPNSVPVPTQTYIPSISSKRNDYTHSILTSGNQFSSTESSFIPSGLPRVSPNGETGTQKNGAHVYNTQSIFSGIPETTTQFNTVQIYSPPFTDYGAVPTSNSVDLYKSASDYLSSVATNRTLSTIETGEEINHTGSYLEPSITVGKKFPLSQEDFNSLKSSDNGWSPISGNVYDKITENLKPHSPILHEHKKGNNLKKYSQRNNYKSHIIEDDPLPAASEDETIINASPLQISGYSHVTLQNSKGRVIENPSEVQKQANDPEKDLTDLRIYLDKDHPASLQTKVSEYTNESNEEVVSE